MANGLILSAAIATAFYCLHWWRFATPRTNNPDSRHYINAASGNAVPVPYNRRFLAPLICRTSITRWKLMTAISFVTSAVLVGIYAGRTPTQSMLATALFVGLSGIACNVAMPVLVDLPGMALALGAAIAWQRGWYAVAIVLTLLAGATKESAPVFAAIYAWNPLLLVGCVAAGWWRKSCEPARSEPWLARPIEHARKARDVLDYRCMLLPLGAIPVLAAWGWEWTRAGWIAAVAVVVAAGQLVVANDTSRLLAWAVPAVLPMCFGAPMDAVAVGALVTPFVSASWKGV